MSHRIKCPVPGCEKYISIDNPRELGHIAIHGLPCDDCQEVQRQWAMQRALNREFFLKGVSA